MSVEDSAVLTQILAQLQDLQKTQQILTAKVWRSIYASS